MGSVDKLLKSLELLRAFNLESSDSAHTTTSKKKLEPLTNKDKITNCNILCECICSSGVRSATDFPNYLGVVLETALLISNDRESDVRMVADECLNKITKTLLETNLGRMQVEYFKELKKNGPSRCVRNALWRFAELCPLIRLQKRRVYAMNLLPCLSKLAERHEEALQECLSTSMSNICSTLMPFATDQEIKAYIAPFLSNLCSTSSVLRRVASNCSTLICRFSRKPMFFFDWLLVQVLDLVLPIMHIPTPDNIPILLGSLHCIRLIIPYLTDTQVTNRTDESVVKQDTTIMVFELVLHCMMQSHPSIVTGSLECLQQLLRTPLPEFIQLVLTPGSINASVLAKAYETTMAGLEAKAALQKDIEPSLGDSDSTAAIDSMQVNLAFEDLRDGSPASIADNSDTRGDAAGLNNEPKEPLQSQTEETRAEFITADRRSLDSSEEFRSDVGSLTDTELPPVLYCVRLVCSTFLLNGEGLHPDRDIRVSIKSLALSCISYIVRWYPDLLTSELYRTTEKNQIISDILEYRHHNDPQLQGNIALVLGNALHSIITNDRRSLAANRSDAENMIHKLVEEYVSILEDLLKTSNSICTRLALSALRQCLGDIMHSSMCTHSIKLMKKALDHKQDSYWLVKVELLELLSEVDFSPVFLLEDAYDNNLQEQVLGATILHLLSDSDHRVRQAASLALVRIIPLLFYPTDHPLHSVTVAQGSREITEHIYPLLPQFPVELPPLVHGLVHPYNYQRSEINSAPIQSALIKIVYRVIDLMNTTSNQNMKLGGFHALSRLAQVFEVTRYPHAWGCSPGVSCTNPSPISLPSLSSSLKSLEDLRLGSGGGPIQMVLSFLTFSPITLDLLVHNDLILLAGNLLSGSCYAALRQAPANGSEKHWPGIYDRSLVSAADKLLIHIVRLLNIFSHILEDLSPVTGLTNPKAVLDAARDAITSPIKKRVGAKSDTQTTEKEPEPKTAKEAEKGIRKQKETMGTFHHIPFYMKLYDSIKGAHHNYKVTLSLSKADKFSNTVSTTLQVFSQLLEVTSLYELGKCTEEILQYLRVIISVVPQDAIIVVHQLLKSLFGTNIWSQFETLCEKKVFSRQDHGCLFRMTSVIKPGLFNVCLATPYAELTQSLAHNPFRVDIEDSNNSIYVIKKCLERKMPAILKPSAKVDKNTVGAYIRMFEPLVIKGLKMYTLSSSAQLQSEVLSLLVQLVQLRVNYCLLDNDEVFLGYVLKQLDMISEGPMIDTSVLIRGIFQFLLLLSYEKLHSKVILVMPRIIQLCDGVMASGKNSETHAIPALEMLVQDLFLTRAISKTNSSDPAFLEIETQREVVVSMLLRLIKYTKVLELLILVLHQAMNENEERWKKLSRQIVDLMLPLMTKQQITLDDARALYAVHNIFLAVSPSVYRPVDILLKALFVEPIDLASGVNVQRWLCCVLVILRVLLQIGKEEVILSRLNELEVTFDASHMTDSLDSMISSSYGSVQPQEVLSSFMVQVISFVAASLQADLTCPYKPKQTHKFARQQLSQLLLYTSHMLQSGHFRKIAKYLMEQVQTENSPASCHIAHINEQFRGIGTRHPTLMLQWCNILILLNYEDQKWWSEILLTDPSLSRGKRRSEESVLSSHSLNSEIVRCGALAMFCDYVVENIHDAEHMTWLIMNHVNDIIEQMHEAPVQDFMSAIHSNSAASGLFIQAIHSRYELHCRPSKLRNALQCLKSMHKDQSGALLVLLMDKFLKNTVHVGVMRLCDSIACRRVEMLLAEEEKVVHSQLSEEDLQRMLESLRDPVIMTKHRRLTSLLDRLREVFYQAPSSPREDNSQTLSLKANKSFYIHITKFACCQADARASVCASMLGNLETEEIYSVISSADYQLSCLAECIRHGAAKTVRSDTGTVLELSSDSPISDQSPLLQSSERLLYQLWQQAVLPTLQSQSTDMLNSVTESLDESAFTCKTSDDILQASTEYLKLCQDSLTIVNPDTLHAVCTIAYNNITWWNGNQPSTDQSDSSLLKHINSLYVHLEFLAQLLKTPHVTAELNQSQQKVLGIIKSVSCILIQLGCSAMQYEETDCNESKGQNGYLLKEGCLLMSHLVTCLADKLLTNQHSLPFKLAHLLETVIVGLARLSCVNQYARMPISALVMNPPNTDDITSQSLHVETLQDTTILTEFIKRSNLLGWISRQQFEETWACLLQLLTPVAVRGSADVPEEVDVENIEWMVLALRGITSLLSQTLIEKEPGNALHKCYKHRSRQRPIASLHTTRVGEKLRQLRLFLHHKSVKDRECLSSELLCANTERISCALSYGQLSIDYITTHLGIQSLSPVQITENQEEKADTEISEKLSRPRAESTFVDTASCLKLLMDVFSQLLSPNTEPKTPLMLLNESVKSIVVLSDIFHEQSQYGWMFNVLYELHLNHSLEDEIMNQYLVLGLCKSAALHAVDGGIIEKLAKLIEHSLKSTHIPTRLAVIHGCLYIFEADLDSELTKLLLPSVIDFCSKNVTLLIQRAVVFSELYSLALWSLSFYIIENFLEHVKDSGFTNKVIMSACECLSDSESHFSTNISTAIISGLERLLLRNSLSKPDAAYLMKLASDRLSMSNQSHVLPVFGLLVTCMYADISNDDTSESENEISEQKMELVSLLFDRVRKGLPHEAEVITALLPSLMVDFFTAQDIMNKVIGEFLSGQQPHPTLIARMIYEVFEKQLASGGKSLVLDWVLLSVSNCTQRSPLAMAIWCLNCFFVSSSQNEWLRGLFPFVSSRMGILEQVDEQIFLASSADFYSMLNAEAQQKTFLSTFQSAARNEDIYKRALSLMENENLD